MYAIVEIAGLQYKVEKDQRLYVNRLNVEAGKKVKFDRVLLIEEKGDVKVGASMDTYAHVSTDGGKTFKNIPKRFKHVDNHRLNCINVS